MYVEELQKEIMEELDLSKDVPDEVLQGLIHQVIREHGIEEHVSLRDRIYLGRELFNSFRKLDILQDLLEDPDVTEIMINGTQNIFVEVEGRLLRLDRRFVSQNKLEDLVQQIVGKVNRIVNEASPIVDARLEDGSRVNIVLNPIAMNGPIITIRKFPHDPMTMADLIRLEALSQEVDEMIKILVESEYNIFVSGGTGSG